MISEKQMQEIREHLKKAENPVFFFDNDTDGLCSFLLLQRAYGKGKGFPVRGSPELDKKFFSKVNEFNADYIFALDLPRVSMDFFEKAKERGVEIVWIDHHILDSDIEVPEFVNYYNSYEKEQKSGEPVTYICYKITGRKQDLWLAITGCIGDKCFPEFYYEFKEQYPELAIDSDDAFDVVYGSEIGKLSKMLNAALKDKTTNVVKMMKLLYKAKSPYDVLNYNSVNSSIHKRFLEVESKYQKILNKFKRNVDLSKEVLYFEYRGDLSITGELANELSYRYPNKKIIVVYCSEDKINVSARGENIKDFILKVMEGLEGSTGGGHKDAVGAKILPEHLDEFRNRVMKMQSVFNTNE